MVFGLQGICTFDHASAKHGFLFDPLEFCKILQGCHSSWTLKGLFASGRVWGSKHRSSQAMTGRQWYLVIFWRMCWGLVWSIPAEMFPGSPNITNVFWMIHIQKNSWSYPGAKYSPRGTSLALETYIYSVNVYKEVSHNQNTYGFWIELNDAVPINNLNTYKVDPYQLQMDL